MSRRARRGVLGLLLVLLTATVAGCGLVDRGSMTVTAILRDSAGLFTGNDVGVLGVPVGEVERIEPEGDHVRVTLRITDDDVSIPADAGVAVVARSVATDRYVELTPVYRSGPRMEDGAVIPLDRTVTPVDFDQVLASVKQLGDGLTDPRTANDLRDLVDVAATSLDGRGAQLNRTVTSLAAAVRAVNGQQDDIFGTMDSLDTLTRALVDDEATVRAFIRNVADASDLLASERRALGRALRTLSAAVDEVAAFADRHRGAIKRDVVHLTAVMNSIVDARRDLEETVEVLPLATHNLALTRGPTGNVRVRTDMAEALPAGTDLIKEICAAIGTACDGVTLPPNLDQLLGGLLGPGGG